MKEYLVKKMEYAPGVWDKVAPAEISLYKWLDNGYEPRAEAKAIYDGKNIYVRFDVWENKVKAVYKNMHDQVCKDSCVEFFFRPMSDPRYFNFEVNAAGTLLLGLGEGRHNRERVLDRPDIFEIKASVKDPESFAGDTWSIEYKIPFEFLEGYYGKINLSEGFMGNFYKCGDLYDPPHYGMWNEVKVGSPDFHRPEFFGKIKFEV